MKNFKIESESSWYTDPISQNRKKDFFLKQSIEAFYHDDYLGGDAYRRETIGTIENIITTLKNDFNNTSKDVLEKAGNSLITILESDLPQVLQKTNKNNLTVCIVPRAKALTNYATNQLVFKMGVAIFAKKTNGFSDGTNYITRHTDTTTHLNKSGCGGNGDLPYLGITKTTCTVSEDVKGKDILLIDDLYTKTINIDEDVIQTLLDNGDSSVTFYSIGKTKYKNAEPIGTDVKNIYDDDLPF